jgi:hypothetical protein
MNRVPPGAGCCKGKYLLSRLKSVQEGIHLLVALKMGDIIAFFVVQGQEWKVLYFIEGWQRPFLIPSHFNIWMIRNAEIVIEFLHFRERLIGGHHNLNILELAEIGEDIRGLVFAMFTFRVEEHDQGLMIFFQIIPGKIRGAVQPEQVEGGDGGKPEIGWLDWRGGRLGVQAYQAENETDHCQQSFHPGDIFIKVG